MQIRFPQYDFEVRIADGVRQIHDRFRRRWVAINPEEWVRQHLLNYMAEALAYPQSRISVERKVEVDGQSLRFDALIYDRDVSPWMIVECKAPEVKLTDEVLRQALRYNAVVGAPFLCLCNGIEAILIRHNPLSDAVAGQSSPGQDPSGVASWQILEEWPEWNS